MGDRQNYLNLIEEKENNNYNKKKIQSSYEDVRRIELKWKCRFEAKGNTVLNKKQGLNHHSDSKERGGV